MQPCDWPRSIGIIFDRQTVTAEFLFCAKLAAEKQCAVRHMDSIFVYRQVGNIGFQFHHFQKSRCPFCKAAGEKRAKHFIDFLADTFFISDTAILGEEAAAHTHHRMLLKKLLTESDFIHRFAVIPKRTFTGVLILTHSFPP